MRILLFGKTGQVARELHRRAPADVQIIALGRDRADLMNPSACADAILSAKVDAVINAAAWTAVDRAESDEAGATIVNAEAPAAMARAAAKCRLPFLHISTDYVFDGAGEAPFSPEHPTAPLSAYGRSKLSGEAGVRAANGPHLILRTSWVFSAHGSNFVKTMLRLGGTHDSLRVVADQIGGPTPAAAIADALFTAARAMLYGTPAGTHHLGGTPETSWADFARAIMADAKLPCVIHNITSASYPTPARRPLNSRLDCTSLTETFGITPPNWRAGLSNILQELTTP